MQSRLTAFAVAVILLLGTSNIFAQREQVAEYYSVTPSDFTYQALTRDNSDNFRDLSNEEDYDGSGPGSLIGDYDEGLIVLGAFGQSDPYTPSFDLTFMGDYPGPVLGIYTNGGVGFLRRVASGGGTIVTDPLWNPAGSGYYSNTQVWTRAFAFQGDLDLTSDDAKILVGERTVGGKTYLIVEWQEAEFFFTAGGPISFQLWISDDVFTAEIHAVFGPNASTIPAQNYYTGLNDGTAADTDGDPAAKDYDGDAGNYIAARWIGGQWESTTDASDDNGIFATFGAWPSRNVRFCLAPDITAEAEDAVLFNYERDDLDIVAADAELTKTYRVSNPATSDAPIQVTMDVSGLGADSYTVDPPSVDALDPGTSQVFNVTFKPAGFGVQEAEVTVGVSTIAGADCPVVKPDATLTMIGLVPGLVNIIEDEDPVVDFQEVGVNSDTWRYFELFTNDSPGDIKYTFTDDGLAGTEFILTDDAGNPTNSYTAVVGPGENASVPLRFLPTDQGIQNGTIEMIYSDVNDEIFSNPTTVDVFGEATPTRIEFLVDGEGAHAPDGSVLGRNGVAAVGENPVYRNFTITNTSAVGAINLENFMFYEIDRSEQFNRRFRIRWTEGFGNGEPIMSKDFYVERNQNGSWVRVGPEDRITLATKETAEMRAVFAPQRPGFKYVRMFFETDATVDQGFRPIEALDPADELTPQLLSYELYGFGARNSFVEQLGAVVFPMTEVGRPATREYLEITNTGDARLLVDINSMRLWPGDDDFTIGEILPEQDRTEQGKAIIPIGETGRVYMNFTPQRAGTRFTTLYFVTNDSTPTPDGLVGERYVTVTGVGEANAKISVASDGQPLFANVSAIVDAPETFETANITVTHEGGPQLVITNVRIDGLDADDYMIVSTDNTGPVDELGSRTITVQFAPMSAGMAKEANLIIESNAADGDQVLSMTGNADTRLVSADDVTLFVDAVIATGESVTESVVVENVGTVDLTLNAPSFSSADYSSTFSGGVLTPGQAVSIDVTLSSTSSDNKTGTMSLSNNSTNQDPVEITLGGYVGLRTPDAQRNINVTADWIRGTFVPETVNLVVTNVGDLPLTLDPTTSNFSGPGMAQFSIVDIPTTEIASQGQVTVVFEYAPDGAASAEATLNLASNGDPSPLQISINGTVTDIVEQARAAGYELMTSSPNPVHNQTVIEYSIPSLQKVSLELFDMRGQSVAVLVSQLVAGGTHTVNVDCSDLPAGSYIYKLSTADFELTQSMQVVR